MPANHRSSTPTAATANAAISRRGRRRPAKRSTNTPYDTLKNSSSEVFSACQLWLLAKGQGLVAIWL
ncbi:hypothetical protein D3C72_2149020 [compost metagenome]